MLRGSAETGLLGERLSTLIGGAGTELLGEGLSTLTGSAGTERVDEGLSMLTGCKAVNIRSLIVFPLALRSKKGFQGITREDEGPITHLSLPLQTYEAEHSNLDICKHHPGFPVFHEGLKYWSCCQKKTTDFSEFLEQVGCSSGHHCWVKLVGVDLV